MKNPQGYTKYSLEDVPDVSNRSNSAAAFDFLRQLKDRNEEDSEPPADLSQKIVFKKRGKKDEPQNNPVNTDSVESPKTEVKSDKSKGAKSNHKNKSKQMTLSHLDDEDEDDF